MFPAVDDVHHRHRQHACRRAANIPIQRERRIIGSGLGDGKRNTQYRVGPQAFFVFSAVQLDHGTVDLDLFGGVDAHQRFGDFAVHRCTCFQHTLAQIAFLITVPALDCLIGPGGSARRYCRTAHRAVLKRDIYLYGGVASAIQYFAGVNVDDGAHRNYPFAGVVGRWFSVGSEGWKVSGALLDFAFPPYRIDARSYNDGCANIGKHIWPLLKHRDSDDHGKQQA